MSNIVNVLFRPENNTYPSTKPCLINIWCKQYCQHDYTIKIITQNRETFIQIQFNHEDDYLFFKLAFPQVFYN